MFVLGLALLGCRHAGPGVQDAAAPVQAAGPSPVTRLPLAGLRDVACAPTTGVCLALTERGVYRLHGGPLPGAAAGEPADATILPGTEVARTLDTLTTTSEGWRVEGACEDGRCAGSLNLDPVELGTRTAVTVQAPVLEGEVPSLVSQGESFAALWNAVIAHHWRVPFLRTVFTPTGGPVALLRGVGGQGQLMRAGMPPRLAPLPVTSSPATWPAGLALHPSGGELYVLLWPTPTLRAVDPLSLATRWTAPLEGAGQGLFIHPGGRFVLVSEGPGGTDRFVDWPIETLDPTSPSDPCADERLRLQDRPPQTAAVVVDLATHAVAARASGAYRRWLSVPGASQPLYLLATDREVVLFQPPEPPV